MTDARTKHEHYYAQECVARGVTDREVIDALCRMVLEGNGGTEEDKEVLRTRLRCSDRLKQKLEDLPE